MGRQRCLPCEASPPGPPKQGILLHFLEGLIGQQESAERLLPIGAFSLQMSTWPSDYFWVHDNVSCSIPGAPPPPRRTSFPPGTVQD